MILVEDESDYHVIAERRDELFKLLELLYLDIKKDIIKIFELPSGSDIDKYVSEKRGSIKN